MKKKKTASEAGVYSVLCHTCNKFYIDEIFSRIKKPT